MEIRSKKSVLRLRKIMISFVVENFSNNKLAHKTPRYKFRIKLLKSNLISALLKFTAYKLVRLARLDKYWESFIFLNYLNRSSSTLNLTLSYYFHNLYNLVNSKNCNSKSISNNFNSVIKLLGLPISFKTSNFILFYSVYFNMSYYAPFYKAYLCKQHYFYPQQFFKTYNNLNFYYSKVYEH